MTAHEYKPPSELEPKPGDKIAFRDEFGGEVSECGPWTVKSPGNDGPLCARGRMLLWSDGEWADYLLIRIVERAPEPVWKDGTYLGKAGAYGNRPVHLVRDGMWSNSLNEDGTLYEPTPIPDDAAETWTRLTDIPSPDDKEAVEALAKVLIAVASAGPSLMRLNSGDCWKLAEAALRHLRGEDK